MIQDIHTPLTSAPSTIVISDQFHLYLITICACLIVGLFSMLSLFIFSILINHQPNPFRSRNSKSSKEDSTSLVSTNQKQQHSSVFVFDPNKSELLKTILSFAVGGLLGDVFLHLLPEAGVQLDKFGYSVREAQHYLGGWILAGVILFTTIESMFVQLHQIITTTTTTNVATSLDKNGDNSSTLSSRSISNGSSLSSNKTTTARQRTNQQRPEASSSSQTVPSNAAASSKESNSLHLSTSQLPVPPVTTINVTGYLNLLANSFDNFTHGMAVGASFLVGYKTGILTTVAIAIHEMPHEIADYVILIRSGFSSWDALRAQLSISLVTMVGALSVLYFDSGDSAAASAGGTSLNYTLWILPFTAGGFIYIALTSLLPELLQLDQDKDQDQDLEDQNDSKSLHQNGSNSSSTSSSHYSRKQKQKPTRSRFHNIQCLLRRLTLTIGGIFIMAAVNMIDLF